MPPADLQQLRVLLLATACSAVPCRCSANIYKRSAPGSQIVEVVKLQKKPCRLASACELPTSGNDHQPRRFLVAVSQARQHLLYVYTDASMTASVPGFYFEAADAGQPDCPVWQAQHGLQLHASAYRLLQAGQSCWLWQQLLGSSELAQPSKAALLWAAAAGQQPSTCRALRWWGNTGLESPRCCGASTWPVTSLRA